MTNYLFVLIFCQSYFSKLTASLSTVGDLVFSKLLFITLCRVGSWQCCCIYYFKTDYSLLIYNFFLRLCLLIFSLFPLPLCLLDPPPGRKEHKSNFSGPGSVSSYLLVLKIRDLRVCRNMASEFIFKKLCIPSIAIPCIFYLVYSTFERAMILQLRIAFTFYFVLRLHHFYDTFWKC